MPGPFSSLAIATTAVCALAVLAVPSAPGPTIGPAAAVSAPRPAAAVPIHPSSAAVDAELGPGLVSRPPGPTWQLGPMFSVGARAGPAPRPGRGWQWPLRPGPSVVRPFAVGPYRWSAGHRGVDLTPAGRAPSAPTTGPTTGGPTVVAAAAGVVRFAGVVAGRPVVSVDHGSGVVTTYEPVRPTIVAGAPVRAGQAIGALAPDGSHCAPAWCLHWGAIVHGSYVDPLTLLRPRDPPILLPLP